MFKRLAKECCARLLTWKASLSERPIPTTSICLHSAQTGSGPLGILDTDNDTIRLLLGILPVALFLVIIIGVILWIVRRTSR